MEKLPPTAYVRMVDIWLIFGQLIPFIEVVLLTLRELYTEQEEINHHGSERNVGSSPTIPTINTVGVGHYLLLSIIYQIPLSKIQSIL